MNRPAWMATMRRREFITGLGGTFLAQPVAVRAQPVALATIGFLGPTNPSVTTTRIGAFEERLRRLGWTKDANLRIGYRWAEGHTERFAELAAELVRSKVRVIVTRNRDCGQAGDVGHSNCVHHRRGPRGQRTGRKPAGREAMPPVCRPSIPMPWASASICCGR
jgi:hypothetical protein